MAYTLTRHRVEDYMKWRDGFDAAADFRKASGEEAFQVFTSADKPNEVWVLNKWSSLEAAKTFMASDELKQKMKEVGVSEAPDIYFLDEK